MDWFPFFNSIRIAAISVIIVFFAGIASALLVSKLSGVFRGLIDVFFTLPLVLPPTVVGFLLIKMIGPNRLLGKWLLERFSLKITMTWWAAIIATAVIIFPLMYRTARGAFESYDETLSNAGRTLGKSELWIFLHVKLPVCKKGIIAGIILSFARALGEYGATSMVAGYTPGKTATIATTVYQLWRTDNDALAFRWVLINIAISTIVLLALNAVNSKNERASRWH